MVYDQLRDLIFAEVWRNTTVALFILSFLQFVCYQNNGRFSIIKAQRDLKTSKQPEQNEYQPLQNLQSHNSNRVGCMVSVMTTIDQRSGIDSCALVVSHYNILLADIKPYRVVSVWYETKKDALITATITPNEGIVASA